MKEFNKVFGIGMSKSGTTTLGACFKIVGLTPHKDFDTRLKRIYRRGGSVEPILKAAEHHWSFVDSPCYRLYRELD